MIRRFPFLGKFLQYSGHVHPKRTIVRPHAPPLPLSGLLFSARHPNNTNKVSIFFSMGPDCARGRHDSALLENSTTVHFPVQAPPSIQLQPATTSQERLHQQQPIMVYPLEWKPRGRPPVFGTDLNRVRYPVTAGLFLLVSAILAAPMSMVMPWDSGIGMRVFAQPCQTGTTTTSATGGGAGAQQLNVTPTTTNLDITSVFACEGGDFEVHWSGEVSVSSTIFVGSGTTVRIYGDGNSSEGNSSLSDQEGLEELTSGLVLPLGLSSAVVGTGSSSVSFGPMFYVDGGHLILEDLIVRGGYATNESNALLIDGFRGLYGNGGGVYAINSSVSIARCEFSDNFAEHLGGGIFANLSSVEVVNSAFRYCTAGHESTFEDEDLLGTGGGISVSTVSYQVQRTRIPHKGTTRSTRERRMNFCLDFGFEHASGSEECL